MKYLFTLLTAALILVLISSCSKKSSNPSDDDHTKELKKIDSLLTTQSDYSDTLNVLFTHLDSTVAKDSLVKILLADPNVQMAQSNSQGILVQYTNGMRGGILLNPEDGEDAAGLSPQYKLGSTLGGDPGPGHKPSSKKTIFLNPSYWERQAWADPLTTTADAAFAKVGMNAFEKYVNAQCTIDKFTSLSGYGVVHIYTHGIAWPNKNNIQEVYMLTGETASQATTDKYFAEIKAGKLPIVIYAAGNKYCISPSFFARHNNFSDDTTLVYGGFCYSGLGGWKDTLPQIAKAGAYVGFDWHVLTNMNSAWARFLYKQMSDTSRLTPLTLGDWRDAPDTNANYFDNEPQCQKWVSVWNYGYADLVLWRALKIYSIDPPTAPVGQTVRVKGVGFGQTKGMSTITFNGVTASPTTWSDTLIVTAVPEGTTGGPVIVTVGDEHSNNYPFALSEISIIASVDTLWMLPYDTTYISATVTGSSDTAVVWRVVPQLPYSPGWFRNAGVDFCTYQVSNMFVGIGKVVAKAHADTMKTDTITVMVSLMDKLRATPYFYISLDGKFNYNITCTQAQYTIPTSFNLWNQQGVGLPRMTWEGNTFYASGGVSFNSTPWIYYDTVYISGTVSPMGDSLLNFKAYFGTQGSDPTFRSWSRMVEATNIRWESFYFVKDYNYVVFGFEGSAFQDHLTSFEDYYYEENQDGSCRYERSATTMDWGSTEPEPDLQIKFDITTTSMPMHDPVPTKAQQRSNSIPKR
jgi:hypothetical protein